MCTFLKDVIRLDTITANPMHQTANKGVLVKNIRWHFGVDGNENAFEGVGYCVQMCLPGKLFSTQSQHG